MQAMTQCDILRPRLIMYLVTRSSISLTHPLTSGVHNSLKACMARAGGEQIEDALQRYTKDN